MYEERLGTGWKDLSEEEVIDRTFALGVASVFGYENEEEFDRLYDALDSSYDRSIVDLAYEEGKQEARQLRGEGPDEAAVWDELVGGGGASEDSTPSGSSPYPASERSPAEKRPESLDRATLIKGGRNLEALRRPSFLRSGSTDDEDKDT